jgi:hypothetical protein
VLEFTNHDLTRLSTQTTDPVPAPGAGFADTVVQTGGNPRCDARPLQCESPERK